MLLKCVSGAETDLQQILYEIRMLSVRINQLSELNEILQVIVSEVRVRGAARSAESHPRPIT